MRTRDVPAERDRRPSVELSAGETAALCAGCVHCCSYVAVEVQPPRSASAYDQWIWALHHEKVEMYVERPEAWFVQFETRCRQLDGRGRCSIHGRHPVLCREYDPRACERRLPLEGLRAWFRSAADLEAWLARERPAHWTRLLEWRRRNAGSSGEGPEAAGGEAGFIPLAAVLAGGAWPGDPGVAAAGVGRRRGRTRPPVSGHTRR